MVKDLNKGKGHFTFEPPVEAIQALRRESGMGLQKCRGILHKENMLRYLLDKPDEQMSPTQLRMLLRDIIMRLPE